MSAQTTSNSAAQPKQAKKTQPKLPFSRFRQLFFIRRFPKFFGGIPEVWDPPELDEDYQRLIHDEGFVAVGYGEYEDLTAHPVIMQDVRDLNQHLLPTFFMLGQKARYYQNQFYMYQWVFIVGAFLTTLFGTLALYFYGQVDPTAVAAQSGGDPFAVGLSYLTAIIGAITAFTTTLSNRGEPRKRWSKVRRLTEETRASYFRYLAHLPPYETPERVQRLREMVVAMQIKEQENV
jgi:hypothetical protein